MPELRTTLETIRGAPGCAPLSPKRVESRPVRDTNVVRDAPHNGRTMSIAPIGRVNARSIHHTNFQDCYARPEQAM
jgi:hypothetical protein